MSLMSEYANFSNGKKRPSAEGEYPVYGGNGILGYTNDYNMENGIIIGRVGVYCGSVFLEKGKCWVSDNAIKAENTENSNLVFLYYLLKNLKLNERRIGTSQPLLTQGILNGIEIDIPNIFSQEKIAEILEEIDKKIVVNNEINDNLFQQMESLYKAWFTDYVPFNGNRPVNWAKSDIYSIADIIYGAPFASKLFNTDGEGIPIIRIRDLKEQAFVTYTTENHPKGHLIQPGDIIVGMDGEFRPYIWGNTEAWLNQRVCIFDNKRPKGKAFVFYTIKPLLYRIEQTQVATTVIHIGKKDYDAFEFYLPDNNTLDQFDEITAPMIDQIVVNFLENKRLSELRDALLPRLMSGELDVSDIDF
jgi:type I restriction enzyme S subunit